MSSGQRKIFENDSIVLEVCVCGAVPSNLVWCSIYLFVCLNLTMLSMYHRRDGPAPGHPGSPRGEEILASHWSISGLD